jgi:glycosyltransferase involved in cell wall biosynthesis
MTTNLLNQIIVGAGPGDAITDHALLIRRWLRDFGFTSEIFAEYIHPAVAPEVRPIATYRPGRSEPWLILHHSIGSPIVERVARLQPRLILVYHNITPPEFFAPIDPAWAERMALGRQQLDLLRPRTGLALADSPYNEQELQAAGFAPTGVLSISLDEQNYNQPANEKLLADLRQRGPTLLFVGRLSPNKKQEDLVKLLYYYRRIEPDARLILVGDRWLLNYDNWLEDFARSLDLGDALTLTGHVSQQDMITYYRAADLYVSMSEHEGFGKPLLESMYLGLPVLAYAASAVPATLGDAGVLFHQKDYEWLAELVDILVKDNEWRQRLIGRQRQRVQSFLEPQIKDNLRQFLEGLQLL